VSPPKVKVDWEVRAQIQEAVQILELLIEDKF
jgi:hypothetical protein